MFTYPSTCPYITTLLSTCIMGMGTAVVTEADTVVGTAADTVVVGTAADTVVVGTERAADTDIVVADMDTAAADMDTAAVDTDTAAAVTDMEVDMVIKVCMFVF